MQGWAGAGCGVGFVGGARVGNAGLAAAARPCLSLLALQSGARRRCSSLGIWGLPWRIREAQL